MSNGSDITCPQSRIHPYAERGAVMLDGFLLFCIVDVWRVLLPLGLSIVCFGTYLVYAFMGKMSETGLCQFLCLLNYRVTVAFVVISLLIGMFVPSLLGYVLPERHLAEGPWSYEEICSSLLAVGILWRLQQQIRQHQIPSGAIMATAVVLFMGIGLLWVSRWDAMANVGQIAGGWFLGGVESWDWSRLLPKIFHVLFSAMVAGGILVAAMGLLEMNISRSNQEGNSQNRQSQSSYLTRYGVGWILSGLVPQMLIGPWLFLLLENRPQMALIEGVTLTSLVFFVSLTTSLLALVLLNASFMAPYVRGLVWGGLGNVAIALILMGIVRYETFAATVFSRGVPSGIGILSGWHVLSVFVLVFLLGVILYRWCVHPATVLFRATWPLTRLDNH